MILDALHNADKYMAVHSGFKAGFKFLWQPELGELAAGKYDIEDGVYAIVIKEPGRKKEDAQIEIHKHWLDIQYVIAGTDNMGWKPASELTEPAGEYDSEKDLQFFYDKPTSWVSVGPNEFAVFFPEDAHLPMISDGELYKVVIKIRVDQ